MMIHRYCTQLLAVAVIAATIVPGHILANDPEGGPKAQAKARVVVARVNGEPIYEDQMTPQVNTQLKKFKKFGAQETSPDLLKRLQEKALENLIDTELLYQASKKTVLIPDIDEKVDQKMADMKKFHSMGLKKMTDEEVRESVRRQIYVKEYLNKQGLSDPKIPEAEVRKYYEENKQAFASKGSVNVRHILCKVPEGATPEQKKDARAKIEEARRRILKGEPFAEIAKKYSECNSAPSGGDLGRVEKGYMPPEFDAVAFSIEKGKLSESIETKFGYHILEVTERVPEGSVPPYEELSDFMVKHLKGEASRKETDDHVKALREKATIERFLK